LDSLHNTERYLKNEGKHQLEDAEQRKAYQREYHRDWYKKNKAKVASWTKSYYDRNKKIKHDDSGQSNENLKVEQKTRQKSERALRKELEGSPSKDSSNKL